MGSQEEKKGTVEWLEFLLLLQMARCWYFEWDALLGQHELASGNVWQKHEGRISWTGHMGLYRQSLCLHDGFVLESVCHSCLRSVTNYNWHRDITPCFGAQISCHWSVFTLLPIFFQLAKNATTSFKEVFLTCYCWLQYRASIEYGYIWWSVTECTRCW